MAVDVSVAGDGDAHIQAPAQINPAKRKRDESEGDPISSLLVNHGREGATDTLCPAVQRTISNIHDILKSQDTAPSILQFDLASFSEGTEPTAKRAKLSSETLVPNTITTKVSSNSYRSLDEFTSDVDKVMHQLTIQAKFDASDASVPMHWPRAPDVQELLVAKIAILRAKLHDLVVRETDRMQKKAESKGTRTATNWDVLDSENLVNGHIDDSLLKIKKEEEENIEDDSKTVLTLYANAQGHKQLFSSLPKPISPTGTPVEMENVAKGLSLHLPLKETGLPNGIFTTKIIPGKSADMVNEPNKRSSLFKDVFGPRSQLLQLQPPRTPKLAFQQSNSTVWQRKRPVHETTTQRGYSKEKMVTGHWLGYAGVAPAQEPATPEIRRKLRDRALSSGEAQLTPSEEIINAQAMAREEALFRSVYSSFAPSCDNSGAIYSDEVKANVWWERYGQEYFDRTFAIDPALESAGDIFASDVDEVTDSSLTDEQIKQAIEEFESEEVKLETKQSPVASGDQGVDEMLKEISELLETLHSYQRIRNSSLSSTSRPGSRPGTGHGSIPLHRFTGTPSAPSTAEIETYNTLKAQLALMISILPPYAVARLNGEMLEELNVTTRIPFNFPDARGVMEEDSVTRESKAIAMASASHQARANSMSQGQYASSARTAQMVQPTRSNFSGRPMYNGTYNTPHGGSNFSRQPLSSWQSTPTHSYTSNSYQRGAAAPSNHHPQQPMRAAGASVTPAPYRAPVSSISYNTNRPGSGHHLNQPASPVNGMYQTPQSYNFPNRSQSTYQPNAAMSPTKGGLNTGTFAASPQQQPVPRANMTGGYSALQIAAAAQQQVNMRQQQQNPATATSSIRPTSSSSPQPQSIQTRDSPAPTPAPVANMNSTAHMQNGAVESSTPRPTSSASLASSSKQAQSLHGSQPSSLADDLKQVQQWNEAADSARAASPQRSHTSTPLPPSAAPVSDRTRTESQSQAPPNELVASSVHPSNGAQHQQKSAALEAPPSAAAPPPPLPPAPEATMVNGTGST